MKANVEKIETNQIRLEVEVDSQELEEAAERTYRKLVHKYSIPGFRKGKVPRSIFENYIGAELLYQEAADSLLPSAYTNAVKETAVEPIDQPQLEIVQLEAGKPFIFRAEVTVFPEVTLGQYKGLEANKRLIAVQDEQVEGYLKSLQERHARLVTLEEEGQVQNDDIAVIDFEGFIEGEAFEGGKGKEHSLGIGSNSFIPGFEEQLVGLGVGEEKDVVVTFPEDYHSEEVAGKKAIFKVTVRGIKRKELSPLDDEFAKDISEFETLEELRADAREKLEQQGRDSSEAEVREQVIKKAIENIQVEIPQVMIEHQIDFMLEELDHNFQMQGLSLEQFLAYTGKQEEELRDEYQERAKVRVLRELTLEAIAKEEKIEAGDEDVDQEIQKIAERFQRGAEEVRANFTSGNRLEDLKRSLVLEKTVAFLVQAAKIKEVTAETEELAAETAKTSEKE